MIPDKNSVEIALKLKLKNVTSPKAGQFYAICPLHDDKSASLSFNTESMTWNCHAGCGKGKLSDFLDRIGVEWKPKTVEPAKLVATYDYRAENGYLLYQVCRYEPKTFKQRRPKVLGDDPKTVKDDWVWSLGETRRIPYRLPELVATPKTEIVFLVEGEKDVENLRSLGLCATTTCGGANSWRDSYAEFFKDRNVVIIPDNDDAGMKYAQAAQKSIGINAKVLLLPGYKDVSVWIGAGGTKEKLLAAVTSIKAITASLKSPWESYAGEDRVVSSWEKKAELAKNPRRQVSIRTGIDGLDRLTDGVRGGEMVVIGGKTKNGKTLICQTITRNLQPQKIMSLWFSYEVPVEQFLEQMPDDLLCYLPNVLTTNALDWIRDRILEAQAKFGIQLVFIDHLHYLVDMAKVRNPSLEIGAIVRTLKRMCIDLNVAMFLISHVRGVESGVEITDEHLRDSAFTRAEADTTWMVSRVQDKETTEFTDIAKLKVSNHRRTGVMGKAIYLKKNGKLFEEYVGELPGAKKKEAKVQPLWTEPKEVETGAT